MTTDSLTTDNCANEPIHIPGAIQPHGALLVCALPTLITLQASSRCENVLGFTTGELLGRPLAEVVDSATHRQIEHISCAADLREHNPLSCTLSNGRSFAAVVHRVDDLLVLELEPPCPDPFDKPGRSFDPRMRSALLRLHAATSVLDLCQRAAEEVRHLTGFDRVMVYRFDADWNGEVVAECKDELLEPYLGQRYPASDIPAQARRLYTTNWLRFIGDVDAKPEPLEPVLRPDTGEPLDLSKSVLRAVSPIHIEYLRNMGVRASMSVSIVIDGKLMGLIACHHYASPHVVPFTIRDSAEYLGQALSSQLHLLETRELEQQRRTAQEHESEVLRSMASTESLLGGLACPALLGLANAQGAAVVLVEGTRSIGNTPAASFIDALVAWLAEQRHEVFHTDHLSAAMPRADGWHDVAAGVLAVAISRELKEYILWFRPAVDRTVRWAGDPRKVVTVSSEGKAPRLSPRGSFALWLEIVKGRSVPWEAWQVDLAGGLRRVLLGGVRRHAVTLQTANTMLIDADRLKDEFIATVSHELRTPLNAIRGWTDMALDGSVVGDRLQHALGVIDRNVRQQTRLVDDLLDVSRIANGKLTLQVEPVELAPVVQHAVEAAAVSAEAKGIRLTCLLDSDTGLVLGDGARLYQIAANLIVNAIKFTPKGGHVTVALQRSGSDLELSVVDNGQGIDPAFLPHVFELFRQQDQGTSRKAQGLGLGLALVKRLVELHGGRVQAHSPGSGLGAAFYVRIPLAPVRLTEAERATPLPAATRPSLAGLRLLVVEDENDARELLVHILQQAEAEVLDAANAQSALALLENETVDVIVSDVGMPTMDGLSMMRAIRDRGWSTPAIALTAYTRAIDRTVALQSGFQAHVPKPVDREELLTVVASLAARL